MPKVPSIEKMDYIQWAKKENRPMPDLKGWVHESHWQEFLLRKEGR